MVEEVAGKHLLQIIELNIIEFCRGSLEFLENMWSYIISRKQLYTIQFLL